MRSSDEGNLTGTGLSDLKDVRVLLVEILAGRHSPEKAASDLGSGGDGTCRDGGRSRASNLRACSVAALVDFNLREGERAHGLIDRLHDEGIR